MSAKRPRPAIPVLVHVDNPAEVGSVTVDTSTIEGKMDTVITNQNRIYDKIPTSSGGGAADLSTVNEKTTALAAAIGPASSTSSDDNIFGHVRNLQYAVGDSTKAPSAVGNSVRDILTAIKENTASGGGGGSADLTTVNEKITALAETIGPVSSTYEDGNLLGRVKNISRVVGDFNVPLTLTDTDLRSLLYNVREAIGYSSTSPTTSGTSIRNKLAAINTNTTAMMNMIGTNNSSNAETSLIGAARNLVGAVGSYGSSLTVNGNSVRSLLFNVRQSIGEISSAPTTTGTNVRDLLLAIKENTASGGGGGSADLTTVNEKTTALATAIGSASDDSSTVSVIGLLKSITDKY